MHTIYELIISLPKYMYFCFISYFR